MSRVRHVAILTCLAATCAAQPNSETVRPISNADAVLAIYCNGHGFFFRSEPPRLVVVAWDDGRILWSENLHTGGAPYRTARIERTRVRETISRLDRDGIFDIAELSHGRWGPDADYTAILIKSGDKRLEMQSWHELVEEQGGNVRKTGVISGENPRFQVLKEEPQDYLFYRFVWAELRSRALALIPKAGESVDGEVSVQEGDISWRGGNASER